MKAPRLSWILHVDQVKWFLCQAGFPCNFHSQHSPRDSEEDRYSALADRSHFTGNLSRALAPYAKSIVGVDISPIMVKRFNERAHNQGIPDDEMKAVCAYLKGEPGELDNVKFDVIVVRIDLMLNLWRSADCLSITCSVCWHTTISIPFKTSPPFWLTSSNPVGSCWSWICSRQMRPSQLSYSPSTNQESWRTVVDFAKRMFVRRLPPLA